jgi:hypothetical protein
LQTYTPDAGDVGFTLTARVTSTLGALSGFDDSPATTAVVAGGFSGILVINDNKANTTTTFTDDSGSGNNMTPSGSTQYNTTSPPTGMTSSAIFDGSNDNLSCAADADLGFGTGDFTIEFFARATTALANDIIFDMRTTEPQVRACFLFRADGDAWYYVNGAARIEAGPGAIAAADAWYYFAVCRSGTTTRMYIGAQSGDTATKVGSNYTDSGDYGASAPLILGESYDFGGDYTGRICSLRIRKGVAAYTDNTSISIPSIPFA